MVSCQRLIVREVAISAGGFFFITRRPLPISTTALIVSARLQKAPTASLLESLQQQRRSMVMVTKTSAESLETTSTVTTTTTTTTTPPSANTITKSSSSSSSNDIVVSQDVKITKACFDRIRALAQKRTDGSTLQDLYLRLYVDAGGCSGFQYKFEIMTSRDEADDVAILDEEEEHVVFEYEGARVVVDTDSLNLVRGSTIDYVQEMIKSSFVVLNNPQSESACGCGSSFAVKNFEANPAVD
jgi:iron-sulfur cluster assembly accessory protein